MKRFHSGCGAGWLAFLLMAAVVFPTASRAATKTVGDIVNPFILDDFLHPGETISLSDYAGSILVIDLWAYWCEPCWTSTPQFETDIRQYYIDQGGNPSGIPVEAITVSLDNGDLSNVQDFVDLYQPSVVGLENGQMWTQFGLGYIPHFAVINCTSNSDSHAQWELVYNWYSNNVSAVRAAIDSITVPVNNYQQWRHSVFSPGELLTNAISGDFSDPDSDGIVNWLEYVYNLLPKIPDSDGRPFADLQSGYLAMTYRQNKTATNLQFIVESSQTMASNSWSNAGLVEVSREDSNTYWSVTVRDAQPLMGQPQGFMRLKVEKP